MKFSQTRSTTQSPCCGNWIPWAVLLGLVLLGSGSRLLIADLPNFKPLAAIALFSGFYFRSLPIALAATAMSLLISDWHIGSYDWPIAASVYGSLLVGCIVGRRFLRGNPVASKANESGQSTRGDRRIDVSFGKSAMAAFAMSCLFFVVTNFAVWATGLWYPSSLEGFVGCYANAIPFFKYTVAGDLAFTMGLFGVYAIASALAEKRSPAPVVQLK